jgi:hypothetical protein
MPLSTLRLPPLDGLRKTRGQDGSLLLSCKTLSFSTSCRFIPAHGRKTIAYGVSRGEPGAYDQPRDGAKGRTSLSPHPGAPSAVETPTAYAVGYCLALLRSWKPCYPGFFLRSCGAGSGAILVSPFMSHAPDATATALPSALRNMLILNRYFSKNGAGVAVLTRAGGIWRHPAAGVRRFCGTAPWSAVVPLADPGFMDRFMARLYEPRRCRSAGGSACPTFFSRPLWLPPVARNCHFCAHGLFPERWAARIAGAWRSNQPRLLE